MELLNHGQTGVRFTREKALARLAKRDEKQAPSENIRAVFKTQVRLQPDILVLSSPKSRLQ